jgi:hypothetical protein
LHVEGGLEGARAGVEFAVAGAKFQVALIEGVGEPEF